VERLQVGCAVRLTVQVDEHDRLPLAEQALTGRGVSELVDAVGGADLLRSVAPRILGRLKTARRRYTEGSFSSAAGRSTFSI
jgi:hypothetical protein